MAQPNKKEDWKLVKFWMNKWIYLNRVKKYADDNSISISDVMRLAITHFFKTNS